MKKILPVFLFGLFVTSTVCFSKLAQAENLISGRTPCTAGLVCDAVPRTPREFVIDAIAILLSVAGAVSVLFVIIGGFRYVTAQGDEKKVDAAKSTLKNAIIGTVIILLSYAILQAIQTFVDQQV